MKVRFADTAPDRMPIAYPIAKGGLAGTAIGGLGADASTLVRASAAGVRFEGEAGTIAEAFIAEGKGTRRIILVGTGGGTPQEWERAGGAVAARLLVSGETGVAIDLTGSAADAAAAALLAAGARQRAWRHDVYRTRLADKQKPTLEEVTIVGAPEGSDAAWAHQDALTQGVAFTRALVSDPPNILFPEEFVARCRDMETLGVKLTVLDEAAMREAGMGALLGVSQGSVREARLLAMHWNGTGNDADPPLALVGKGVTFDTGGISLKPGPGMEDMKWDMGGAGAVAGAIRALALRKAKANVVGICGLVENMPDGAAQRPGDIVTSMSGQTIEILNTDAEGRLVLCDAITWVQKHFRPRTIVDLATLTGAMIIALGNEHGGLFSNDDELAEKLAAAGKAVGDPLWRFPLSDAYNKLIDSPIADMKNVGPRGAGSITAAQFIQRFVDEGVKWAHLDIAGMVWADKPGATWDKGATGYGVRLLDRFVAENFEA
ncbi:leucyl aminopeptidase [Sphingomonas gilva]|uniref:Probable cytosol aminopeptidase n=1 Tax=Sphingomonas gilva TaxID=2305907 RepID=A0A396RS40_9SPHN|nr:leucyl aminopeptidase [Sphingomonas gilva]RHW16401.1 leucyl aminopeptidase [Sphingomonas gilva]